MALRLHHPHRGVAGGADVVNIYELERDRERARLGSYVCADPVCHAAVRPVFPLQVSPARRRSPRGYFSAHPPSRHNAACRGDLVLVENTEEFSASRGRGEPHPIRQAIPSRFRDDVRVAAPVETVDTPAGGNGCVEVTLYASARPLGEIFWCFAWASDAKEGR